MGGTILNVIMVLIGSTLGLLVGNRLSAKINESVITGLGLVTLYIGVDNGGETGNIIIPLLSIAIGVIIGELLELDAKLDNFAGWLQERFASQADDKQQEDGQTARERFITGFVTASLVFCIGPLAFLGSIQDGMGLRAGFDMLSIKSVLDAFASMAFAASFGIGVAFSILSIIVIQGGLALVGYFSGEFMTDPMIAEMTATGGIVLMGLSLILLDIKKPRIANFLPALVIAPVMVALAEVLGINIYPL